MMREGFISVLVAEDEKLIANNIAKTIERVNPLFRVVRVCANGEDALRHIQHQPPHIVVTDIRMPLVDGLRLICRVRELNDHIKTVIVSGYSDFDYAKQAIALGASAYLLKPVSAEELKSVLDRLAVHFAVEREDWLGRLEEQNYTPEDIVAQVKEYMNQNCRSPIDLHSISEHFGFSSAYLSRIFSKIEGMPPSKYIRMHRMNIAKQLLADPGLSVHAISNMVGYADPFHFSKTFKSTTNMSPATYRKQALKMRDEFSLD